MFYFDFFVIAAGCTLNRQWVMPRMGGNLDLSLRIEMRPCPNEWPIDLHMLLAATWANAGMRECHVEEWLGPIRTAPAYTQHNTHGVQFARRMCRFCTASHVSAHRCGCAIRTHMTIEQNTLRVRYGACGPGGNPTYERPWRVTHCRAVSGDPMRGNMRPTIRIDDWTAYKHR